MTDETIFAAALDKADSAERTAFLTGACADPAQRRRVERLLAAHDAAGTFLDQPAGRPDPAGADTRTIGHDPDDRPDPDDMSFLAPPRRPDSLGRIGHYEVLEVLGKGGFGIVFRAFDDVLQRVVAVKVLAPAMAATSPARKRFLREARSAAPIQHENVVRVHAVEEQPLPYLVMEFIRGETLQHLLDRTGPLDVAEILRVGRQLAEGLDAAHAAGLIHRDIKPANVLIEGGPQKRVKITDFGLARAADDASISQSGVVAGTPMYMAPEQAKGDTLDHRADLFSLGSVLYVMCTGRPPFRASGTLAVLKRVCDEDPRPIREVIPEVPEWLCRVVEKLHSKDPDDRFQSAKEVADVLADCERQLQARGAVKDFARVPEAKPAARPRSGRWRWAAVAALVVALAGVGLYALTRPKPLPGPGATVAWGEIIDPLGKSRFAEADDRLTVTVPGDQLYDLNPLPGFNMNAPRVLRAVEGDFEARVTVLPFPRPTVEAGIRPESPYTGAGLIVWLDDNHLLRVFRAGMGFNDGGTPYAHVEWFALGRHSQQSTFVGDGPLHLRVRRTGGVLRVAYSPDGRTWTDAAPPGGELALGGRVHVGVAAVNALDREFVARFEGFAVNLLPAGSAPPASSSDGFVPLFNGKDLAGWSTAQPDVWKVVDGVIVGKPRGFSHLATDRSGYANFHLRARAKVNAAGDAGVWFRFDPAAPFGSYEAQINCGDKQPAKTGSLVVSNGGGRFQMPVVVPKSPVPPDTWFTLEVIAEGPQLTVRVNGETTASHRDTTHTRGRIALEAFGDDTLAHFSQIEIKELPPAPASATVDLLALIDPKRDALQGTWTRDGKALVSPPQHAQLQVPFVPPADYRLTMDVERTTASGALNFGLIVGGRTACVSLDYKDGLRSGIAGIDGKMLRRGEAVFDGPALGPGRNVVVAEVRGNRLVVRAGATTVIDWEGDPARLAVVPVWARTDGKRPYLGNAGGGYRFHRLELEPLATPPTPPLAVAPFDTAQAKTHQEAWAKHLGADAELTNSIGMKLRLIPPGEFQMGSTAKEIEALLGDAKEWEKFMVNAESPQRAVRLSAYYMGAHEVTQADYLRVTGANPSEFSRTGKHAAKVEGIDTDRFPVESVSWDDAVEFCRKLSELPAEKAAGRVYRLPTEAQWEYACRAGTVTAFHTGDALAEADANFDLGVGRPRPVGGSAANGFGLYDMHGNVFEWCQDWFTTDYRGAAGVDPPGPASGDARVVRGGNYGYRARFCRSAARDRFLPVTVRGGIGFRVVVTGDLKAKSPAAAEPKPAVLQPLRDAVAAKARVLEVAQQRVAAGVASEIDLLVAAVDLTEARVKLAEEEQNPAAVVAQLEELVKLRGRESELVLTLFGVGRAAGADLAAADARFAEAKARLAKVKPVAPFTDADVKRIAALPGAEQAAAVEKELKARNPGSPFYVTSETAGGVVTELWVHEAYHVTDISPVRALAGLKFFGCDAGAGGHLTDVSPLHGLTNLTRINLAGMRVGDAALARFKDFKNLTSLKLNGSRVTDLSPLKDLKLTSLHIDSTQVSDLSPLKGMPLKELWCDYKPERDAAILRAITTLEKINDKPVAEFWK